MMFLDCPAYLDQDGALRCGLPAEVRCRFTVRSTDGPLESAMIRCPAGHYFCGAIESSPGTARTSTIRALPDPVPAPGVTASSAVMTAVTVAADPARGMSPPGRTVTFAARTPLPPTTWATMSASGSPSCARAGGAPPLITQCKLSPVPGNERHPATAAPYRSLGRNSPRDPRHHLAAGPAGPVVPGPSATPQQERS